WPGSPGCPRWPTTPGSASTCSTACPGCSPRAGPASTATTGPTSTCCSPRWPTCPTTGSPPTSDRKSTRLNSSHVKISYAVFCLNDPATPAIYTLSLHDALPILARQSGLPAVADDSGLCVDVLNGMPGVFSARWSGKHGDDRANLDLLLAQVAYVPDDRLTAHFRSEEHTSELQSRENLVCRLLLERPSDPRHLHSFPTRRSSDLGQAVRAARGGRRLRALRRRAQRHARGVLRALVRQARRRPGQPRPAARPGGLRARRPAHRPL